MLREQHVVYTAEQVEVEQAWEAEDREVATELEALGEQRESL